MLRVNKNIDTDNQIIIIDALQDDYLAFLEKEEAVIVQKKIEENQNPILIQALNKNYILYVFKTEKTNAQTKEKLRRDAHQIYQELQSKKEKSVFVQSITTIEPKFIKAFLEGLLLSQYIFDKYKKNKKELVEIFVDNQLLSKADLQELNILQESVRLTKNLVNEPQNFMTTTQYNAEIKKIFTKSNVRYTYWNQEKITKEKMGGILAVNRGSENPAFFHILEYKPTNAINKQPLVLVGKGVMYDTGGLSIKPTPNSMDLMKCDMAGSATVLGAILAISKLNLPYYVIGLFPTVENKINDKSICPGDVITMYDGTTVEVMNTDAEGRLILADALHYAKRLKPELVIDLATLTGAAIRAVGKEAAVVMGNADKKIRKKLEKVAYKTDEKIVYFPLWDDYKSYLDSEIADIKNIGGAEAGAITAGKFLEHFTDYSWLHIDLSPAFVTSRYNYRGIHATAFGVRLLCKFVKNLSKQQKQIKNVKSQPRKNKSRNNNR